MSERKTAEIKFRIEPSVKAFWQAQAADETDGNLSELITKATNQHVHWAKENARLDGTKLLGNAIEAVAEIEPQKAQFPILLNPEVPEGEAWLVDQPEEEYLSEWSSVVTKPGKPLAIITNITDASPQEDVSTSDEVGANHVVFTSPENVKVLADWTFEGQNG